MDSLLLNEDQEFGGWHVEAPIKGDRTLLVTHPNYDGLHVLKKASTKRKNSEHSIKHEVEALKYVGDHPNIISLVDYNKNADVSWHVTELCAGDRVDAIDLKEWDYEMLKTSNLLKLLDGLANAIGYLHCKGVTCRDFDIFFHENKFVLGDFEMSSVIHTHHVHTAEDLKKYRKFCTAFLESAKRARIWVLEQQDKQREVLTALENAPPSAPRRLEPEKESISENTEDVENPA